MLEYSSESHYLLDVYEDNYNQVSQCPDESKIDGLFVKFVFSYSLRYCRLRSAEAHEVHICLSITTNKEILMAYPSMLIVSSALPTASLLEVFFYLTAQKRVSNPRSQGHITDADLRRPGFCRIFMLLQNKRVDIAKFKDTWFARVPEQDGSYFVYMNVDIIAEQSSGIKIRSD